MAGRATASRVFFLFFLAVLLVVVRKGHVTGWLKAKFANAT